jgi:hypothetical protein
MFIHRIEGFDTAKFAYGTSSAKQITVSFYVKSSLTGDFSFAAQTGSRNYVNEYTINSANTWERKSFTLPVLTTGTHNTTNGSGIAFIWDLGSGDDYATSTLGSWVTASNLYRSTGSARLSTNVNTTWQITGIQVEEGTVMTDFEHFPVGHELALCQRYYFKYLEGNNKEIGAAWYYLNNHTSFFFEFPTTMRTVPTGNDTTGTNYYTIYRAGGPDALDSIAFENGSTEQFSAFNNSNSSGTAGQCGLLRSTNASAKIEFSAEL